MVFPEPRKCLGTGLRVGILSLPVVQGKRRLAQGFEGMLGLGGLGGRLVVVVVVLFLGSGGRLWGLGGGSRLGLLLGGRVLDCLVDELEVAGNRLVGGLVDDEVEPTSEVGVRRAESLVKDLYRTGS